MSIHFVYIKYSIGVPYVLPNTHGTHKVHTSYTQGIHKVTVGYSFVGIPFIGKPRKNQFNKSKDWRGHFEEI